MLEEERVEATKYGVKVWTGHIYTAPRPTVHRKVSFVLRK